MCYAAIMECQNYCFTVYKVSWKLDGKKGTATLFKQFIFEIVHKNGTHAVS